MGGGTTQSHFHHERHHKFLFPSCAAPHNCISIMRGTICISIMSGTTQLHSHRERHNLHFHMSGTTQLHFHHARHDTIAFPS
jgi:hypothetical protein